MPSKQDHLSKAAHNEKFAEVVNQTLPNYRDWAITAYFYSAVHYIEAYLATRMPPVHSPDHRARDDEFMKDPVLNQIFSEYSDLKNDSTNARYEMRSFSPIDITRYVIPNHERIKNHILSQIR